MMRVVVDTPEQMAHLGARIADLLRPGDVVALDGELGAGKTTLTRGLGERLGVRGAVTSPTFVLARTHPRAEGAPLVHVDAYRLGAPAELDDLDVDFAGSITVVEWASGMVDGLVDDVLWIGIERQTGGAASEPEEDEPVDPRVVTIRGTGVRWADVEHSFSATPGVVDPPTHRPSAPA